MTQIDLEEWLTSPQGDTPASPSRLPGSDEAIKMTDISGQKCLELSKLSGPLGSLEKMLLATSLWASTRCYLTWKPQATPAGALLFRLSPQTLDTSETDAGLLHTPTAKANQMAPSMKSGWNEPLWATPQAHDAKVGKNGRGLGAQFQDGNGGSLNPQFVEWLMGYPVGYTGLNN